jgi:hypothetical protein
LIIVCIRINISFGMRLFLSCWKHTYEEMGYVPIASAFHPLSIFLLYQHDKKTRFTHISLFSFVSMNDFDFVFVNFWMKVTASTTQAPCKHPASTWQAPSKHRQEPGNRPAGTWQAPGKFSSALGQCLEECEFQ